MSDGGASLGMLTWPILNLGFSPPTAAAASCWLLLLAAITMIMRMLLLTFLDFCSAAKYLCSSGQVGMSNTKHPFQRGCHDEHVLERHVKSTCEIHPLAFLKLRRRVYF